MMEYSKISRTEYTNCQAVADKILRFTSNSTNKSIYDVKAPHIINTFYSRFRPNIIVFYPSSIPKHYTDDQILRILNQQFDIHGFYMQAKKIISVDDIFTNTVAGLTWVNSPRPTLFLNITSNNFKRLTFTCLHEFAHMYQAERSQSYMEALALINADKIQGNPYPEELQPIENEANVIASLLLVPDKCLKFDILHSTFNEIQDKYGISKSALFNRLQNYFYYSSDFDEYESNQAAHAFLVNDNKIIYQVRKKLH